MARWVLLLPLLVFLQGSICTLDISTAPPIFFDTVGPICVNFSLSPVLATGLKRMLWVNVTLINVSHPCSEDLMVWLASPGLARIVEGAPGTYLFANPGSPCTALTGNFSFTDNAGILEEALCPQWPSPNAASIDVFDGSSSEFAPQGLKNGTTVKCNASFPLDPQPLSIFFEVLYVQIQLCAKIDVPRTLSTALSSSTLASPFIV